MLEMECWQGLIIGWMWGSEKSPGCVNNWVGDDALSSGGGHWRELLLDEWSLRDLWTIQ